MQQQDLFSRFAKSHRHILIPHVILTVILLPLELIIFSFFSGAFYKRIQKQKQKTPFISLILWFFLAMFFLEAIHFTIEYLDSLIIPRLDAFTRMEVLDHVLHHRFELDDLRTGEIMHRLSKAPGHLYKNYSNRVRFLFPVIVGIVFFIVFLFWIHWGLGVISIVSFGIMGVVYIVLYFHAQKLATDRFTKEYHLMDHYEDTIHNWQNIRMADSVDQEKQRLREYNTELIQSQKHEVNTVSHIKMATVIFFNIVLIILLIVGVFLVRKQALLYWKLIILITSIILLSKTLSPLICKSTDNIYYATSIHHLREFIEDLNRLSIRDQERTGSSDGITEGWIRYEHVSFTYPGTNRVLLKDIHLSIPPQTSVLILGKIGSGKSTLVRMLLSYYQPTKGRVSIDDIDIQEIRISHLLHHVTYMPQHPALFDRTMLDNIFYQLPVDREALSKLPLTPTFLSKLDQPVGKNGKNLSGGEKQMVLLLRCYFKPCKVVILDEPTASLDVQAREHVIILLETLCRRKTVICITHDETLTPYFQRVYRLQEGNLSQEK